MASVGEAAGPSGDAEQLDVLVVGAGLSGIGAACHLRARLPGVRFAVVEARAASGGTWDLFRYPGIRSDSDMYTLGYRFRPWTGERAIADGASILAYLRETARECGVDGTIRYRHRVTSASWSSADARWRVEVDVERDDGPPAHASISCAFLFMCSGYYDYAAPYAPAFAGSADFAGRIVHPQFWTDDIEWAGKRVVVVGSGATAMTLVPALAEKAARVTMLQRSPTWVVARPARDPLARLLSGLPPKWTSAIVRWKQVLLGRYFFGLARRKPEQVKRLLLKGVEAGLGPARKAEVARDFTPRYDPWRQRLCLLPDGDLFRAMRSGKAEVVTDTIDRFVPAGVRLASGRVLDADLIVTATGLEVSMLGKVRVAVDGVEVDPATTCAYKGTMFSGVPNLFAIFGYTNASWTLKSDLSSEWVCRLIAYMRRNRYASCTPCLAEADRADLPWIDFSSGYVQRALARLPRQGARPPWRLHQNYLLDIGLLRFGRIADRALRFGRAGGESGGGERSAA